jgi:hypothetical protein
MRKRLRCANLALGGEAALTAVASDALDAMPKPPRRPKRRTIELSQSE